MKTLKVLSIIGLAIAGLGFLCLCAWNNPVDYESGIGWGVIVSFYLIALSIVTLIKSKNA